VPNHRLRTTLLLSLALATAVAAQASAAPILVTFDSEVLFSNPPNGFSTAESSEITFSDTLGSELFLVGDAGNKALAVLTDNDDSALFMQFNFLASELNLDFGNDKPGFANVGDSAVLTAFLDGTQVGQVSVPLNLNTVMDQNISFDAALFNSAIFKYDVDPALGLTEVVDNVAVTSAAPEPHAAVLFAVGAWVVGRACARRPRTGTGAPNEHA